MDRVAGLDDPQLRAFAPLIFVAWSDFDLDAEARERVLAAIAAQPWLRPAARDVLAAGSTRTGRRRRASSAGCTR